MQTAKLKFTRIEVPDFEKKGMLLLRFHYTLDEKELNVEKHYGYLKEDPSMFAKDLVAEVKNKCRKDLTPSFMEEGVLAGYVNLQLVEDREELTADRVANALKQIRDKIRTIKTMTQAKNYMSKYVDVKGLVVEL